MGFLALNTDPAEDTFCPREYDDLRATVQATYLGGPLLPAVQTAVTTARMTRGENWNAEGRHLLRELGLPACCPAPMHLASATL